MLFFWRAEWIVMEPNPPRKLQFHLTTALFVMVALGALTPFLLRSFRTSLMDGAALAYACALPILIGALEVESYILRREDPDAKYERPRQAVMRLLGVIFYFTFELVLIGIWAVCMAKVIYPVFQK